jgi:NADH-ubiquinone oxidoreductase chain 6
MTNLNLNLTYLSETVTNNFNVTVLNILFGLAISFAVLVIITKNPIFSVLYLIGLFLNIAAYLCFIGLAFIGLAYLLVYVGAISILFLFILMLINIRSSELSSETYKSIPLVIIVSFSLMVVLGGAISYLDAASIVPVKTVFTESWDNIISANNHITAIGNILYTSVFMYLIVTSIILLLAMVGAIVITLKPTRNLENKSSETKGFILENIIGDIADTIASLSAVSEFLSQAASSVYEGTPGDIADALSDTEVAKQTARDALSEAGASGVRGAQMAAAYAYDAASQAHNAVRETAAMSDAIQAGAPVDPAAANATISGAANVCQNSSNMVAQTAASISGK